MLTVLRNLQKGLLQPATICIPKIFVFDLLVLIPHHHVYGVILFRRTLTHENWDSQRQLKRQADDAYRKPVQQLEPYSLQHSDFIENNIGSVALKADVSKTKMSVEEQYQNYLMFIFIIYIYICVFKKSTQQTQALKHANRKNIDFQTRI